MIWCFEFENCHKIGLSYELLSVKYSTLDIFVDSKSTTLRGFRSSLFSLRKY